MSGKFNVKKYYPEISGVIVFVVYLTTLAPSVIQIDSGELAAVQSTLGIAHPTGYPLFTMIGYVFLKIPFPFSKIYQANLLASFWCAFSVVLFIKSTLLLLNNLNSFALFDSKSRKKNLGEKNQNYESSVILISILSGLFLAFTKTYWFQSTSVEVYSLQIFLFNLIIFLSLKAYLRVKSKLTNWMYVGIAFALGFANHMTTILILPFTAILFFDREKFNRVSLKKFFITFLFFSPTLLIIYSYLPIRAFTKPELNWGNPVNLENFLRHVSGKQYQVWLFSSFDSAKKQLVYYIRNLPEEFAYLGLIIILFGMINCIKISRKIFYLLFFTFLFSLLYSVNYDIVDIDSYFLLTYIMLSLFAAFGFMFLYEKLNKPVNLISGLLPVLALFVLNYSKVNQSEVYTFEDYTRAILESVEPNSIILTYQWDYFVSPSYYFQYVENLRKDVAVIDKELLRRSWYYNQLERNYPNVIENIKADISKFLIALKPFENSEQYDPLLLENYYRRIMTDLVSKNKRDFYIGLELFQNEMQRGEFKLPDGYQIVPHNLMFKVVKGDNYVEAPAPNFYIRFPEKRNKYIDFIENMVATMLIYRAVYEYQYSKLERAKMYISKVKKYFKNFQIPQNILSLIEAK